MLNPFREMMKDVEAKGLAGPDVDEMKALLGRMELVAREMSDIAAYATRLAQEMSFQKFGDAYGRALGAAARAPAELSDEEMLAASVRAHEDALRTYRDGAAGDAARALIPTLERIVEIGTSGLTYPEFLRRLEEEGLSRALEGAAPNTRAGLVKRVRGGWRTPARALHPRNSSSFLNRSSARVCSA